MIMKIKIFLTVYKCKGGDEKDCKQERLADQLQLEMDCQDICHKKPIGLTASFHPRIK